MRTVALYLKAGEKNTDMQHRGMELQEKDYKDGSGMKRDIRTDRGTKGTLL